MKKVKRFIAVTIFWLLVFYCQWLFLGSSNKFLEDNFYLLISQIILAALLIFYVAPKFLFKSKFYLFGIISVLIITGFSLIPMNNSPHNPHSDLHKIEQKGPPININRRPHPENNKTNTLKPPSRSFINFLSHK